MKTTMGIEANSLWESIKSYTRGLTAAHNTIGVLPYNCIAGNQTRESTRLLNVEERGSGPRTPTIPLEPEA